MARRAKSTARLRRADRHLLARRAVPSAALLLVDAPPSLRAKWHGLRAVLVVAVAMLSSSVAVAVGPRDSTCRSGRCAAASFACASRHRRCRPGPQQTTARPAVATMIFMLVISCSLRGAFPTRPILALARFPRDRSILRRACEPAVSQESVIHVRASLRLLRRSHVLLVLRLRAGDHGAAERFEGRMALQLVMGGLRAGNTAPMRDRGQGLHPRRLDARRRRQRPAVRLLLLRPRGLRLRHRARLPGGGDGAAPAAADGAALHGAASPRPSTPRTAT